MHGPSLTPCHREDMNLALFLGCRDSSFLTGAVVAADGGMTAQ